MQTNIFDVLGIEVEVPKKQEKKKESKKDTKSIKQEEKKDVVTFPVQIITGYADTVHYQADDFDHGEVTATEVFKKFTSENSSFPADLCSFFMKNKTIMVVFMKRTMSSDKTIMKVNAQTKYCLGDTKLDLSSFMTDTECDLDATILIEGFQKEYPKYGQVKMAYSAINNSIIPCFVADEIENEVVLPVDVVFWNHEEFTITDNDVDTIDQKEGLDMMEESNETITKTDTKRCIKSTHILKLIENRFLEMKGCLKLYYNKETHSIVIPIAFFIAARHFFEEIYQEKGTEALLQLFYDEENRTYFWYIPKFQ